MTPENFDQVLRAFQKRKPFRSFTVELVSGDRFQVDHPEALVYRNGVAVCMGTDAGLVIFDHEGISQFIDKKLQQSA